MARTALETFVQDVRAAWEPLSTELVKQARAALETLLEAPASEPWLAALKAKRPASEELYRDPDHGFVLLAHAEPNGLYRPPHDHGRGWVLYAMLEGDIEIGTYGRIDDERGSRLVKRDSSRLRPVEARAYLPGDIHDTLCLSDDALLLRFTERDLRVEDRQEGRVTRYHQKDGLWVPGGR